MQCERCHGPIPPKDSPEWHMSEYRDLICPGCLTPADYQEQLEILRELESETLSEAFGFEALGRQRRMTADCVRFRRQEIEAFLTALSGVSA